MKHLQAILICTWCAVLCVMIINSCLDIYLELNIIGNSVFLPLSLSIFFFVSILSTVLKLLHYLFLFRRASRTTHWTGCGLGSVCVWLSAVNLIIDIFVIFSHRLSIIIDTKKKELRQWDFDVFILFYFVFFFYSILFFCCCYSFVRLMRSLYSIYY